MPRPKKIKTDELALINPIDQYFMESASSIEEKYGLDRVSSALEEDANLKYLEVPDLGLQWSLGRKGFALGRVMQVMGSEGSSKTSFALWVANICMKSGGIAAMIETEMASSTRHMKNYLSDPARFRIFHADTIEDGLKMTIDQLNLFLRIDPQGVIPKVLIFDSIAGSSEARTQNDEDNFIQARVGGSAKIIKDATNLIKCKLKETNTLWIVLNQGRELIQTAFGGGLIPDIDKMIGSGGKAIPFAATYWLILKRNAATKEDGATSGFKVKGVFKKNKLAQPGRIFYFNVKWGESFDFIESTTNLLAAAVPALPEGADPNEPVKKGGILGLQAAKGGTFFSEELNIDKTEAMKAEDIYELAHSEEYYKRCQEELGVPTEDTVATFNYEAALQNKHKVFKKATNESRLSTELAPSSVSSPIGSDDGKQQNDEIEEKGSDNDFIQDEAGDPIEALVEQ
jgi:RecA/RadA recombinase